MIMLPSGKIVSDDKAKYKGMPPLVDEENDSGKKCAIDEQVGLGSNSWHDSH